MLNSFLGHVPTEAEKIIVTITGVLVAVIALLVNAYATLRNIKSRKLLNYQEIVKSHRELWKLTLDNRETYSRVLEVDPDLQAVPIRDEERRFIGLLLLHMTSAFYFAKNSEIVGIQQLREDVRGVMSRPIPRAIWWESRHYFNRDFVRLLEGPVGILSRVRALFGLSEPCISSRVLRWRILLLTESPQKLKQILERFGDHVTTVSDAGFEITPAFLRRQRIDLLVCFGYAKILRQKVLRRVTGINIHLGYLPYNRGSMPDLWAILEDSPRGVTIQCISNGVNTGDVISQIEVPLPSSGRVTLQSASDHLVDQAIDLFARTWPDIRAGRNKRVRQGAGGTEHSLAQAASLSSLLNEEGRALPLEEFRSRALTLLSKGGGETLQQAEITASE